MLLIKLTNIQASMEIEITSQVTTLAQCIIKMDVGTTFEGLGSNTKKIINVYTTVRLSLISLSTLDGL